ncbi:transcriptional regulator, NifA subfamily, Fis Family [sediment metagenome]|uniref:Transcriptional regulator, NifA subfamily, Fis Family n=1 Tax=sediment metagenome TaxID=749907 RepID=D9PI37_9ZZZZ
MNEAVTGTSISKLESIIELAQILSQQNDYDEVLRLVVEKASQLIISDSALIMMINPKTRDTVKTIYKVKNSDAEQNQFLHINISGWVILNSSPLFSKDIKSDNRFRKKLFEKSNVKSALCVPIKVENVIIGTLLLLKNEGSDTFTESDLSLLEKYSAIVSPFLHCSQSIAQYFISPLPKQVLLSKYATFGMLGKSKKFIELLQAIDAAARCDVRILLEGESGTGKELVARAVHKLSSRSEHKFVAIDCGAIQPNLVESELFGHIRGAYTGALIDRKGLLEEANGGTLFMDEINNLPVDMQSKLLRTLQDEEIRPVGSNKIRKVNVRIITASSSSLWKLVADKKFREDLYYRLNVYPIFVPSLSERIEDVLMLAEHFLRIFSIQQEKVIEGFSEEVLDFIKQRSWPGNIRELENFIERLVTLTTKKQKIIDKKLLPAELQRELKKLKKNFTEMPPTKSLSESLSDYEEELIRNTLNNCKWNQSKAARLLKISEHDIRYKMKKLKIMKPS